MKIISSIFLFCMLLFSVISESKPLDSLRIETINGKKFIIHKTEKGQGLYAIARRYNIETGKIIEANPDKTDKLNNGDLIKIPLVSNDSSFVIIEPQKEKKRTEISTKTLLPTKNKIIKSFPDSSSKKNENPIVEETHANADSKESEKTKFHIVSQGENINKIAQKYKITTQLIYKWNGLTSNKLEIGQSLIVDGAYVIKPYEKWNSLNSVSAKRGSSQYLLSNAPFIEETGYCTVGLEKSILHNSLPIGTLILITNLEDGKQFYVKVTGIFIQKEKDEILIIDKSIFQKLDAVYTPLRVKIQYSLPQ